MSKLEVLLASQAVYSQDKTLFGFELLFRSPDHLCVEDVGGETATSEVLMNHYTHISSQIDQYQLPVFINVTDYFIKLESFLPVKSDRVIIDLQPDILIDGSLISSLHRWKAKGFRFALSEFDCDLKWVPLLSLVDFVKVDVSIINLERVIQHRERLAKFSFKWVAEKVETELQFQQFLNIGFDLFQGYFLAKPKLVLGHSIRPEHLSAVKIIQLTTNQQSGIDEITLAVSLDPNLVFQILKLLNSSLYTLPKDVENLKEAIIFLGLDQLRQWAVIITMLKASKGAKDISRLVLTRAKASELYAKAIGLDQSSAFLVGLLSGVDILLEMDVSFFLSQTHVSDEIVQAILCSTGRLGTLLSEVLDMEEAVVMQPDTIEEKPSLLLTAYTDAFFWCQDVLRSID